MLGVIRLPSNSGWLAQLGPVWSPGCHCIGSCTTRYSACVVCSMLDQVLPCKGGAVACWCITAHPKHPWYKHKQYMSRIYTVLQATSAHGLLLPLLGLRSKGLLQAVIQPLLLTASLFMGPLLQSVLSGRPDGDSIMPLQTLRNLVMAPITEEFCFRACMAPLFLLQVNCFLVVCPQGKLQHCCWLCP